MALTDGLIAHWKFQNDLREEISDTLPTITETFGFYPGRIGNAVRPVPNNGSGTTRFNNLGSLLNYTTDEIRTVAFWFKVDSIASVNGDRRIIGSDRINFAGAVVEYTRTALQLKIEPADREVSNATRTAVTISLSTLDTGWNHIVVQIKNEDFKLFVNSQLQSTSTIEHGDAVNGNVSLLSFRDPDDETLLDDLRVYDRELTLSELQELADILSESQKDSLELTESTSYSVEENTDPTLEQGLLAHWKFDGNFTEEISGELPSSGDTNSYIFYASTKKVGSHAVVLSPREYSGHDGEDGDNVTSIAYSDNSPVLHGVNDTRTFAFWMNLDDFDHSRTGLRNIIRNNLGANIRIGYSNSGLYASADSTGIFMFESLGTFRNRGWVHVIVQIKNADSKIYVNNVIEYTDTDALNAATSGNMILLNNTITDTSDERCVIDDLRVYNRELTSTEREQLINSDFEPIYKSFRESLQLTEFDGTARSIERSFKEPLQLDETTSIARSIAKSIKETLALTEATSRVRNIVASIRESLSLTETTSRAKSIAVSLRESIELSELTSITRALYRSVFDGVTITTGIDFGSNLIDYFKFDSSLENSGTSGIDLEVEDGAPTYTTGQRGNGVIFNGDDLLSYTPTTSLTPTAFGEFRTYSFWVMRTTTSGSFGRIISNRASDNTEFEIRFSGTKLQVRHDDGAVRTNRAALDFSPNVWYHVFVELRWYTIGVNNALGVKIWKDNALVTDDNIQGFSVIPTRKTYFGSDGTGSAVAQFRGELDDFHILDKELSDDERAYLYSGAGGTETTSSLALSESISNTKGIIASIRESLTLTEATSKSKSIMASIRESLALTETISKSKSIIVSIRESLSLTETTSKAKSIMASIKESLVLSETAGMARGIVASIRESLTLTESTSKAKSIIVSIRESLSLTESVSRTKSIAASIRESLSLTEATTSARSLARSIKESIQVSETLSVAKGVAVSVRESLVLTESIAIRGFAALAISVRESLSLTESTGRARSITASFKESLTLSETTSRARSLGRSIKESIQVSETLSIAKGITASIRESLTLTESSVGYTAVIASLREVIALSESTSIHIEGVIASIKVNVRGLARKFHVGRTKI